MMKVPFGVIIGKSPMNTVWLLISPVVWLVNSAVTNSGAQYVRSFSLHSSIEALTSSKRGAENDSDIVPEKSSIGLISSRISARPDRACWIIRQSACPCLIADQPVKGLGLDGQEVGNLKVFGDPAE